MYSPASNATAAPFCSNPEMAMTMYMSGFRSSLLTYLFPGPPPPPDAVGGSVSPPPCLNFIMSTWTLDTPTKFAMAMLGVILLGIAAEFISALRASGSIHKLATCCSVSSGTNSRCGIRLVLRIVIVSTRMLQAAVGYVLMLAAMSYSVELFGCVVLGLALGYCLCFDVDTGGGDDGGRGEISAGQSGGGGAGTCCDFSGRGPPRRAFLLPGSRGGGAEGVDESDDDSNPIPLQNGEDYLSLEDDDKMTPLL